MRQARGTYAPRPCQAHTCGCHNQNSHHCLRYAFLPQSPHLTPVCPFPPPLYRLGLRAELNLNFKHLPGSQTIHSNLISNACFMGFLCFLTLLATGNCVGIFRSYSPPSSWQVLCLPSWAALKLCFIRKSILMRLYSAQLRDMKAGSVSLIRSFIIKCTASNYKSEQFKIYIFKILEAFFSIVKRISIIEY